MTMMELLDRAFQMLLGFVYYYPPFMAFVWMSGALGFHLWWERGKASNPAVPPELSHYPNLSILVPCFNEEANIEETLCALAVHNYPNFEIIAINDGSRDNTGDILDRLIEVIPQLRIIHLVENQGKAIALRTGALAANGEYLLCVDGDVILDQNAGRWMMRHFLQSARVAAVTGNPRIRTRSTLLGKIQVGEFSAIIGLIKRAQRVYGRVFTVSGAMVAFRRSALQRIGFWDPNMITEDIDISWGLQFDHWDIRFEPNALCWLLMPETLKGLWRQRLRWAQGGMEVFLKYLPRLLSWKARFMYLICLDYLVAVFWAFSVTAVFFLWLCGQFLPLPEVVTIPSLLPGHTGLLLGVTCLVQFAFSLYIDSRYEKGLGKFFYWIIWYPIAYWVLSAASTVAGASKALFRKSGQRAVWISPDRGIH